MFKRIISLLAILLLVLSLSISFSNNGISILNKFVLDAVETEVNWYEDEKKSEIINDKINIGILINKNNIYVNNKLQQIDINVIEYNRIILMPVRYAPKRLDSSIDLSEKNNLNEKQIEKLQKKLTEAGYFTIADGVSGSGTLESILKFKTESEGLVADYVVNNVVYAKLNGKIENSKIDSLKDDSLLVLVNKEHNLDKDFVPKDLVEFENIWQFKMKLRKDTFDALTKMIEGAKKEGINLVPVSGYRSYEYQNELFIRNLKRKGSVYETNKTVAFPSESEHQTGLAVDIISNECGSLSDFAGSKAFDWLFDNSYKYGFILRYLDGKTDVTGYSYESWHYRYLGDVELAEKIMNSGKVFEEYLEENLK